MTALNPNYIHGWERKRMAQIGRDCGDAKFEDLTKSDQDFINDLLNRQANQSVLDQLNAPDLTKKTLMQVLAPWFWGVLAIFVISAAYNATYF